MSLLQTCALTGHRNLPPSFDENALFDKLEELLLLGYDRFLCGMAQGFDLIALDCLVKLKLRYRFAIEACIPYAGHEKRFPYAERERFEKLLSWCDEKKVLHDSYREGCFLERDRYMVDHADLVLAYCKQERGGTAYTVGYALKRAKPVIFLE